MFRTNAVWRRLERPGYLPEMALVLFAALWAIFLWAPFYPVPFRDIGDEVWYLGGALQMLTRGVYYRNIMFNDFDGGEMRLMAQLHQALPLHQHVLPYHFPGFSSWLYGFYRLTGNFFWTLALSQSLLLVAIGLLTYRLGLHFGLSRILAWLAATALLLNPSISYFMPNVLPEMLLIALALACFLVGSHTRTTWHHAALAVLLSALVLTRYGFLTLATLIILWQLGRAHRMKHPMLWPLLWYTLPFALHFSFGQNGYLFYRPPAAKCVLDMDFASIVLNTVGNLYYFWQGALLSSGPRAIHANHQDYIYAGLLLVFAMGHSFRHHALFTVAVLGLFAAIGGTLTFCSWWGWQQVRLCLWFLPFTYILGMSLLGHLWRRGQQWRIMAVTLMCFALWTLPQNLYHTLEKLRAEGEKGAISYSISRRTAPWIAKYADAGSLVSVPLFQMALTALIDPSRVYAVTTNMPLRFWSATYRDTGALPDLMLLPQTDKLEHDLAESRLTGLYERIEETLTVMIPGDDKATTLIGLRKLGTQANHW